MGVPWHEFGGEVLSNKEISERTGLSVSILQKRWKKCREMGWPESYAYDNNRWPRQRKPRCLKCPDGKVRNYGEIARMLCIDYTTVLSRLRTLREGGEPVDRLFDERRWYKRKKRDVRFCGVKDKITESEKAILDKIPGPSDLERKVFG